MIDLDGGHQSRVWRPPATEFQFVMMHVIDAWRIGVPGKALNVVLRPFVPGILRLSASSRPSDESADTSSRDLSEVSLRRLDSGLC